MLRKFRFRVALYFDGRELPHAREQHAVMRAGIFHQQRAPFWSRKIAAAIFTLHGSALPTRLRYLVR